jgi:hypothetical protein
MENYTMMKLGANASHMEEAFGNMGTGDINNLVSNEFNPWVGKEGAFGPPPAPGKPYLMQLVHAYRITPYGEWQLEQAVIHKMWEPADILEVQFISDQHRCRLPFRSVRPVLDITPKYPPVRLGPGERVPTRVEIEERERKADGLRRALGLPVDAPLPGTLMEEKDTLRPGETMENGRVTMQIPRWGIPGTTLDALRNRSIPCHQVGAVYGRHFYTNLYQNKFYPQEQRHVRPAGEQSWVGDKAPQRVVGHRYVPLDGPELVQDLATGDWYTPDGTSSEDS